MSGNKIKTQHFVGAAKVYSTEADSLTNVIRGLCQDIARLRVEQFADMTDNSTGTASYPQAAPVLLGSGLVAFTETGTASAQDAATDTSIGKIKNAHSVLAGAMNTINATLGLPLIVDSTGGTIATAGTIPAMDLTNSAVSSACLNVVTAQVTFQQLAANAARLVGHANRILTAVGMTNITNNIGTSFDGSDTLSAITATGVSVNGDSTHQTVAQTAINTELANHAATVATIAAALAFQTGAQIAVLAGTPGGTGITTAAGAQVSPPTTAGAASTSASSAATITELAHINQDLCNLTAQINAEFERNGLSPLLTDSTSATASATQTAIAQTVAGVDGTQTSPYLGVRFSTMTTSATAVANGISSLTAAVNTLAAVYGLTPLTDSVGGVVSATIAAVPATTLQTAGEVATVLATDVNTWLVAVSSNVTTLTNKLNLMTNSTNTGAQLKTDRPLHNVAWSV